MRLGAVYSLEGRNAEAVKEFDDAIKVNRESIEAWYNKGKAHYSQGKYDEAITGL